MARPVPRGTFMQDWLVASYSDEQWDREFALMRELGFRHVILQWNLLQTSTVVGQPPTHSWTLYPSAIAGTTYRGNTPGTGISPVETILNHAEANNMQVYLGLNFNKQWWEAGTDQRRTMLENDSYCQTQATIGAQVARELAALYLNRYPNAFHGWYWAWEVDNTPAFFRSGAKRHLSRMLNTNLDALRAIKPDMPVIISPFFNPMYRPAADYAAYWQYLLSNVQHPGSVILAPQDGVGADHVGVQDLPTWFGALGAAAASAGAGFWANCETFQTGNTPAPISRCIQQFQKVAPLVSDITTFAYYHYDSPQLAPPHFHDELRAYVSSAP